MPLAPLTPSERGLERFIIFVRTVSIATFLFSTLFMFNAMQMLSLVVRPFSRQTFRAMNRWGANTWWSMTVVLAARYYGTRIELSGDHLPLRENIILLSNHQQMADITFLMFLGYQQKRLGDMKWFIKDSIKWFPGIGWGTWMLDCFFVKRNWADDQRAIEKTFRGIIQDKVPLWLTLFPEGTRIKPNKILSSKKFAESKGLVPLKHLLLTRNKGFSASVSGLRRHLDAVYDVTIAYKKGVPTLWQYVGGYTRVAYFHVRRYPIADLPGTTEELSRWLIKVWQEKDQLLDDFYSNGEFPQEPASHVG